MTRPRVAVERSDYDEAIENDDVGDGVRTSDRRGFKCFWLIWFRKRKPLTGKGRTPSTLLLQNSNARSLLRNRRSIDGVRAVAESLVKQRHRSQAVAPLHRRLCFCMEAVDY